MNILFLVLLPIMRHVRVRQTIWAILSNVLFSVRTDFPNGKGRANIEILAELES